MEQQFLGINPVTKEIHMDNTVDTSLMARVLGQNWKTTVGGTLAAAGGVLATQSTGRWQLVGSLMLAIGLAWGGYNSRDKAVSADKMDAEKQGDSK